MAKEQAEGQVPAAMERVDQVRAGREVAPREVPAAEQAGPGQASVVPEQAGRETAAGDFAGQASADQPARVQVPAGPAAGRVDSWIWSVRLAKTRSAAATAIKGGHVRVNGVRVKPAHLVRPGDEVRVRQSDRERVVVVTRVITKRVGPPVAAECYVDNSPPPPPREMVAPVGIRDRGAGRPTKRDRRSIEKLMGKNFGGGGV